MKPRRPRFTRAIDVVEAAYDLGRDDAQWLGNVLRAASPDLELGGVMSAYVSVWREGEFKFASPVVVDGAGGVDAIRNLNASAPDRHHATVAATVAQFASAVDMLGRMGSNTLGSARATLRKLLPDVRDAICATARGGGGYAFQLYAASDGPIAIHPRTAAGWHRVLVHVGNGLRLRRRLTSEAEAILAPDGALVHASGRARERSARERLVHAVRQIERARGTLRRKDPAAALALWSGLVDGRWSLVDQWERDGRRYLAAVENAPDVEDPRGLTRLERDYLDYFLRGVPTKEIAFAFGRSAATVGHTLSSIVRRLRLPNRAALARLADPGALQRWSLDHLDVLVVDPPVVHSRWFSLLTDAEIETALLAAAGSADKEIAAERGVSARTVNNQLTAVFAKTRATARTALGQVLAEAPPRSSPRASARSVTARR
jgi:DNA-binding CsgD family transcriptional regulator